MHTDMTNGSPARLMIRFALPLILSSIFQQFYTLCDSVIVGQLLGANAFAAVGSSAYLDWFPLSMIIGLTQGFGVVFAQRCGAKDEKGFRRAFAMSLLLAGGLGVFLMLLGVCLQVPFLHLLKTPPELFGFTVDYLRVLWLGLMITAIQNVADTALRSLGDSQSPLLSLILSSLLNVALDYLLIAGFRMGVAGAALATVISRGVGIAFSFWRLRRIPSAIPILADFRLHGKTVKTLLRFGIPPLLTFAVTATGELAVHAALNMQGVLFVTGVTAAKRYYSLLNIIGGALEGAVATFVGQNTGAKQMCRVFQGVRIAARMAVTASAAIIVLVFWFSRQLILLFLPMAAPEVLQIGMDALKAEAILLTGLYLLCMYRAAIQAIGNAMIPMLSGFLELTLRYCCVLVLPLILGREGLYYIDAVTWAVTAVMLIAAYHVICGRIRKSSDYFVETV